MAEPSANRLVWLDMEMTGLDPATCVPLEVAIIITDSELGELATYESVIACDRAGLDTMDDFVRNMHTVNGLLDRVKTADTTAAETDAAMTELVSQWCDPKTGVLAGNSIWQDRRFVRRYFPALDAVLHYRMVDVSTIKELTRRWYPAAMLEKTSDHTAMADIRSSINELSHYRANVFK